MIRRHWPAVIAVLAILILGSYLLYTEYLVREIRAEAALHTRMYAQVQRGLLSLEEGAELVALRELQETVTRAGVPIVAVSPGGEPYAWANLPFDVDPDDPADRQRIVEFATRLDRENAPIEEAGSGTIHYGSPPILRWLRWLPWLQGGGVVLLLAVGIGLVRASDRAERERLWAATARELAHQMGTPLSSLSGWVELLRLPREERAGLVSEERVAGEIARDVERLERVSRRFELIGKPPRLEEVDVGEALAELESYLRPRLPRLDADVRLQVRAAGALRPVHANGVLLVWALENLVKNALDALAGRGGRIRVIALGDAERVRFFVVDTGPGVPVGMRNRLFTAGATTKRGGWGVGLSLARRIIEDVHDGEIEVRQRRGGGTVFQIELPVAAAARDRSGDGAAEA